MASEWSSDSLTIIFHVAKWFEFHDYPLHESSCLSLKWPKVSQEKPKAPTLTSSEKLKCYFRLSTCFASSSTRPFLRYLPFDSRYNFQSETNKMWNEECYFSIGKHHTTQSSERCCAEKMEIVFEKFPFLWVPKSESYCECLSPEVFSFFRPLHWSIVFSLHVLAMFLLLTWELGSIST